MSAIRNVLDDICRVKQMNSSFLICWWDNTSWMRQSKNLPFLFLAYCKRRLAAPAATCPQLLYLAKALLCWFTSMRDIVVFPWVGPVEASSSSHTQRSRHHSMSDPTTATHPIKPRYVSTRCAASQCEKFIFFLWPVGTADDSHPKGSAAATRNIAAPVLTSIPEIS